MRNFLLPLALLLAWPLAAQRHKVNINAETPEGQLLQMIGQEPEGDRKMAMMEAFIEKHSKDASAPWVLQQMQTIFLKANNFDKALDAGTRIMAVDPLDVETAQGNLKAAEGKKDTALILQWSNTTSEIARKVVASPKPKDEEEVEEWKRLVDYSKQVDIYTEYALYASGLGNADPKLRLQLFGALEKRSPNSQYLKETRPLEFVAFQQLGDRPGALAKAEQILATDQSNDDVLLFASSSYFEGMKDKAKATQYAQKMIEVVGAKPKPANVADADWQKNVAFKTGLGNWMLGLIASTDKKWPDADKYLRLALPNVQTNQEMKAETLFFLGLANFSMADPKGNRPQIMEAYKFSQQCAAIPGKYQTQAKSNVTVMKQKYKLQ